MNIIKCDGFKINIDYENLPPHTVIYSYERVIIQPEENKFLKLPYQRTSMDKYLKFEINRDLARNGIICLWSNINELSSTGSLEFLFRNLNINEFYDSKTAMMGSGRKMDILTNSIIGAIYE